MKHILAIIVILLLIAGLATLVEKRDTASPEFNVQNSSDLIEAVYQNENQTLNATFDTSNNTVTFNHQAVGEQTLPIAISASGARYANEDESVVFWEHQGELTITKDGQTVFVGQVGDRGTESEQSHAEQKIVGTWQWQKTQMNDDSETVPNDPTKFSITLNEDGTANGTTDCNNFSGSYALGADNSISFSPFVSTLMYCEGSQETEFRNALTGTTHYLLTDSGSGLVFNLKYDSGSVIFEKI